MTTQTKCCVRCKDVEIVKGKLLTEGGGYPLIVCKKADCPCHTQKKSIREELQQVVSAVINTVKEHGLSRGDATHDIMSAFDTALEAIAQKGETLFYLPEGDVGAARMQRKFHNDGIRAFQEIIRSNKSS